VYVGDGLLIHVNVFFGVDIVEHFDYKFFEIFGCWKCCIRRGLALVGEYTFEDVKLLPFDHDLAVE
jgi:hypothetical protein